ncbi:DUF397 domain-containing protein [Sphaerisporangium rhizosphaerae]|uniref:DUF397 domain-containing protein n=1 Tax=Sphaerisporangium rhizosphaerae TaxID=2269375 RepID=A0ABW2P3R2_9ACTN
MADPELDLYAHLNWRKSSHSAAENDCVEVADLAAGAKAIRDSQAPSREPLRCVASEWTAFRMGVLSGRFSAR